MYIAMNRFKIVSSREGDFEKIWKQRETHLDKVLGFIRFHLVKGAKEETYTLYASHSTWDTEKLFLNWTNLNRSVRHIRERVNIATYI